MASEVKYSSRESKVNDFFKKNRNRVHAYAYDFAKLIVTMYDFT